MGDLELTVALYRALAEYARMVAAEAWGTKRIVVTTSIKSNGNYCYMALVVKDLELITMIPQLRTGSYDELSALIATYKNTPGTTVIVLEDNELQTLFENNYKAITNDPNLIKVSGKKAMEILAIAIDIAYREYTAAMNRFIQDFPGQNIYSLAMLFPSWTYSSASIYKAFGTSVFTSTSGIDIVHKGIEVDNMGNLSYSNDTQLSGEVVRCVKHDNIV